MKLSLKEVVFIALLLGMPVGSYVWVFRPANQQFQAQRQDIDTKIKKLEDLRQALNHINDLGSEVDRLSQAVSFFEDKLPHQHEIHKVLARISSIAESRRLETRLFETQPSKPFVNYSELPIKIQVHGDFDAYYQFLLELEQMPRITRIKEMKLHADSPDGVVTAKFTLCVFFQPERQAG